MQQPTRYLELVPLLGRAAIEGWQNRRAFEDVERFSFMIGYGRSGSSLFGSLLNAHPDVVIAHEADCMRYVRPGLPRDLIFGVLLDRDRQFARMGRQWNGFDYALPGLKQGQFDRLRVIGDKQPGVTALRLQADPERLARLRSVVRVPLRVIHLVRNPFDNIASMAWNKGDPVPSAIDRYEALGRAVDEVGARLDPAERFEVRYESFAADPAEVLGRVCSFLGVDATEEYLRGCASLVEAGGRRGRDRVEWSSADRARVETLIATRPALAGYRFDD